MMAAEREVAELENLKAQTFKLTAEAEEELSRAEQQRTPQMGVPNGSVAEYGPPPTGR